jgi:Fe-Mn family superoxide dismutase
MLKPLIAALLLACGPAALAQAPGEAAASARPAREAFRLDPLPYPADALAPVIDRETMELHHGKHHRAYVDKLNEAVAADPALGGVSLERLLARVSGLSQAVRDNAGGHWNHRLFWTLMAPAGQRGAPSKALVAAIARDFGSMERFKAAFVEAGKSRFGSGWVWLVRTPDGRLVVTSTPNQDNPLMDVAPVKGTPILANDLWEHAYYLTWRNRRDAYLAGWWDVVNWTRVNALFEQAATAG